MRARVCVRAPVHPARPPPRRQSAPARWRDLSTAIARNTLSSVSVNRQGVARTYSNAHAQSLARFSSFSLVCLNCHTYYYWYSITHSLFHSRLKSFLFCKSSLPQPFFFLIQVSPYGFPRLFTVTSSISVFLLFRFLHFFSCRFRAVH